MYSPQLLFAEQMDNEGVEDEIDELFSELLQVQPPPRLVERIMETVSQLPLPQFMPPLSEEDIQKLMKRMRKQSVEES